MKTIQLIKITCVLLQAIACHSLQIDTETLGIDDDIILSYDSSDSTSTTRGSCTLESALVPSSSLETKNEDASETNLSSQEEKQKRNPISSVAVISYPYDESLLLKPLPNNYLLNSFSFRMRSQKFAPGKSSSDYDDYSHYTVFPKAFRPILERTSTRQLFLRFTRGFWDAESWGRLPHDGFKSGGSGVELIAIIESESKKMAFDQWKTLANSLSGLFCASINFIDSSRTTYPISSFQPLEEGTLPLFDEKKELYMIRAALANEPICTENLTPFIKLLPTKGKSGFSTLLDGHKVFDSSWHSMSIDIVTKCDDNTNMCFYYMEALVDTVMNVPNALARNERPIPKPLSNEELRCDMTKPFDAFHCFPLSDDTEVSYRLSQIYGKPIMGSNLISNEPSRVCVDVTEQWNTYITVGDEFYGTSDNCFDLRDSLNQDIYLESSDTRSVAHVKKAPIYVSRSLTGYGQDRGGLRTVFNNPSPEPVTVVYFESLPWFMRIYLSTLKLENGDSDDEELSLEQVIESTYYLPASDRVRPTHLEYTVTIPANTSFAISYQFDKSLLKYAEYPPDANHGFEIESAVVTVLSPIKYQIRTATLLLLLSTPDFSMPYNVIILTSTIMGLIFGTMFNLVTKKLVTVEDADKLQANSGIKNKLKLMKERLLTRFANQTG